jgi:hypothetical protein
MQPPTDSYTGAQMLAAIAKSAGHRFCADLVDDRLFPGLDRVALQAFAIGVTFDDFDLAGRFLRSGGLAYRRDLGASWLVRPGSLTELVSMARAWSRGELLLEGGTDVVYPASAFQEGRRQL